MAGHRIPLTTAVALLVLMVLGAGAAVADTDDSEVTLTIPKYLEVSVDDMGPDGWGQGLTMGLGYDNAIPKTKAYDGGDGADPEFVGGTGTDLWPHDNQVPYCKGATNRSVITLRQNVGGPSLSVVDEDPPLFLYRNGEKTGTQLNARFRLGWLQKKGISYYYVLPGTYRYYDTYGTDTSTWLYGCVHRQGLKDPAGTYKATVTVQATFE